MNKKIIKTSLLMLFITPWVLTLILGQPSLKPMALTQSRSQQILTNLSFYSSFEFLFFSGDRRPLYGILNYGVFLLSFLPLFILGILNSPCLFKLCFISGFTLSVIFSNISGLPGSLWFLPPLSVLSAIGFISLWKQSKPWFYFLSCWLIYESLRLYQVIIFHQPFKLF